MYLIPTVFYTNLYARRETSYYPTVQCSIWVLRGWRGVDKGDGASQLFLLFFKKKKNRLASIHSLFLLGTEGRDGCRANYTYVFLRTTIFSRKKKITYELPTRSYL